MNDKQILTPVEEELEIKGEGKQPNQINGEILSPIIEKEYDWSAKEVGENG